VAYLYGEDTPQERSATEAHVAACRACAAEIAGMAEVRTHLAAWEAPDAELGFRITRDPANRVASRWRVPLWAQAAAAVLVLSAGAALANLDIRYEPGGGITLRTGWSLRHAPATTGAAPVAAVAPAAAAKPAPGDAEWRSALASLEQRLRTEFAARPQPDTTAASRVGSPDDLMRQVKALVDASEQRQQRELALRLAQVVQDVEAQRRNDLVRIEQNMGQIEGVTGAEAARQRELLNYLVRVSQRP
jgi:hypothetical protein